ncbi:MAG: sulfotransferase domain-containing protein, partial [Chthoniobacterales bacterium]
VRGKYLIPHGQRRGRPIILLARDPRDAFVSLHLQLTRRTKETPDELKRMSAGELLRDPAHGIESMVEIMNSWLAEWSARPDFLLLRYETLRAEPAPGFRQLLQVLGETESKEEALAHALKFSDFEHMQELEGTGYFDSKILRAGDALDPESRKVRRGKIGGYVDYLSTTDQDYAARAMRRLHHRFGYPT